MSIIVSSIVVAMVVVIISLHPSDPLLRVLPYPTGYKFAFTITDDPDDGWFEQKRAIYDFLDSIGMKTSIGVWVRDNIRGSGTSPYYYQGISLADPEYLAYIQLLRKKGFGLFLHTATAGNDTRKETIDGFETYKSYFGEYPTHWVNHWTNRENIYWGYKRFDSKTMSWVWKLFSKNKFEGDESTSQYFWGDYSQKYIKYVRGWANQNLNSLSVNPSLPYHSPNKPYVRFWYSCSDGSNAKKFKQLISRQNVDKLINEKGTAIVYTHFAKGFVQKNDNSIDPTIKELLLYIAKQPGGWFVPVETILDRFLIIRDIQVVENKDEYLIINRGESPVHELSIEVRYPMKIVHNGEVYKPKINQSDIISIKDLKPRTVISLKKISSQSVSLSIKERLNIIFNWVISR